MRVHALKPVAPSVGDAVEAHYGTDEDELWWPTTNPHPNPKPRPNPQPNPNPNSNTLTLTP